MGENYGKVSFDHTTENPCFKQKSLTLGEGFIALYKVG